MYEIFEELCKQNNVTPYRVSKETGLTTATISNWKAGRYIPKADKLQKIADYFGVSLEYLRTGKEEQTVLSPKNEKDISKTLSDVLSQIGSQDGLMFDGYSLDDETRAYLEASLLTTITNAKIKAKEKYTPNKYKNK